MTNAWNVSPSLFNKKFTFVITFLIMVLSLKQHLQMCHMF
jgi:hypothetical protein